MISAAGAALLVFVAALAVWLNHAGTAPTLVIVTCNVGDLRMKKVSVERMAEAIAGEAVPDAMLLQEVQGAGDAEALAKRMGMRQVVFRDYGGHGNYGVAILARHPLVDPQTLYFSASEDGRCALLATLRVSDGDLLLGSVHLDRVSQLRINERGADPTWSETLLLLGRELLGETVRSRCVEELLQWPALHRGQGIVLGGDFNTVPFSRPFRRMTRHFDDALWPSLDFFKGTYARTTLPLAPRIDFIFHSEDLICRRAAVATTVVGDHRPVIAELSR